MFGWLFGQHSFSNFKIVIAASREAKMASNFCRWSNWDLLTVKFSWKKKFPNSAKTSQQEQKLQSGESACFSWVPVSHKRRHWHLHSFLELQCNGHLLKLLSSWKSELSLWFGFGLALPRLRWQCWRMLKPQVEFWGEKTRCFRVSALSVRLFMAL